MKTKQQEHKTMSNFDFLKTGYNPVLDEKEDEIHPEFMKKIVSLLVVFEKESIKTSFLFAKACGRKVVTSKDMMYSLIYESMSFFEKENLEELFLEEMNRGESEESEESGEEEFDEEYSEDECEGENEDEHDQKKEEEEEEKEDDDEEKFTSTFVEKEDTLEHKSLHENILLCVEKYKSWDPEDPVLCILKEGIDSTIRKFSVDLSD